MLTNRMEELTVPKSLHQNYLWDRPSPIWDVSRSSQAHTHTGRIQELARSKTVHMEYRPCRSVETVISHATKRAVASARIDELFKLKRGKLKGGKERWEEWGQPAWEISSAAKSAVATDHLDKLSVAKVSCYREIYNDRIEYSRIYKSHFTFGTLVFSKIRFDIKGIFVQFLILSNKCV